LQLPRPERRRGAVQPRRDSRQGPPRGHGPVDRHAGVPRQRVGAGSGRRQRRGARGGRIARAARGSDRRGAIYARPAARAGARASGRRADARRCAPRVAEPDPANARGLFRPAGHVARRAVVQPRPRGMRAVAAIAVNVFRESVRDKVLYNLVLFALVLIGASYIIGQLTAGQDIKIIKDLGLAATSAFGLFIAVFIGIGLVSKEVERRSIYALLAKPIHRYQLVLGKYCGLTLTLIVNVAVMATALYLVLAYMAWGVTPETARAWDAPALDPALLKALALLLVELMLVTAIALVFSTFSTPILSAAFTFGLYIVGHFSSDLRSFQDVADS